MTRLDGVKVILIDRLQILKNTRHIGTVRDVNPIALSLWDRMGHGGLHCSLIDIDQDDLFERDQQFVQLQIIAIAGSQHA